MWEAGERLATWRRAIVFARHLRRLVAAFDAGPAGPDPTPRLSVGRPALPAHVASCASLGVGLSALLGALAAPYSELGDTAFDESLTAETRALFERTRGVATAAPIAPRNVTLGCVYFGDLSGSSTPAGGKNAPARKRPARDEPPVAKLGGGLSVEVGSIPGADRAVAAVRGRLRGCYQAGLATHPAMEGRIAVTLSVSPTGAVSDVSVSRIESINGGVSSCIQGVLRSLRFDPPEGGTGATLSGSYSFINGAKGK